MFLEELEDLTFFEKQNIRLIAVTDGTDTASKSYNKLITTVKAAVAEEYSETLSKIPEQHNWNQRNNAEKNKNRRDGKTIPKIVRGYFDYGAFIFHYHNPPSSVYFFDK